MFLVTSECSTASFNYSVTSFSITFCGGALPILRGLPHVKEQFFLAATVQNVKRLLKFLNTAKSQG
jgi:hypothetical protein